MLLQVFHGPRPSFACRIKQQENLGSARDIARCLVHGRITRIIIIFVGIAAAVGDAPITVVDHVTFVCDDHHPIILQGEGPDQRVDMVLYLTCQVAPDGNGHRSNGGIKVEVGFSVQKVAEDTGEGALKQATTPLLHKLPSSGRLSLQARHHLGEGQVAGVVT